MVKAALELKCGVGMLGRLVCVLGILGLPLGAQTIGDGVDPDTAAGRLQIIDADDGFSRMLQVGPQQFFTNGLFRYVDVVDQRGALYLVLLSLGGSGCGADYVWLHTGEDTARLGPMFGTCAVHDSITSDIETVTVTIRSFNAADGFIDFIYDGRDVVERIAGQRSAGVGIKADDWIGQYPFKIFSDLDWRATLIEFMGEQAYRRAGDTIEAATPMLRDGAWVVGRGCRNHQCDVAYGAVALHDDGRILIALRTEERGLEVFGDFDGSPLDLIAEVIQGR